MKNKLIIYDFKNNKILDSEYSSYLLLFDDMTLLDHGYRRYSYSVVNSKLFLELTEVPSAKRKINTIFDRLTTFFSSR